MTLALLTLTAQESAAGVTLDGLETTVTPAPQDSLETTVTHAPRGGCQKIAAPADSDSEQRVTVLNVSRMVSGQEQLTTKF